MNDRVSLIIPGRCEQFFQPTIDTALENAKGDVEIIAVIDGYDPDPPLVARDNRVKLIHLKESIGQRAGYNLGVQKSTGKYVMKVDAHCIVCPEWDLILKEYCPDDAVVLPEMRRLNVWEWRFKPRLWTHFMYIGLDLYCHYWREYRKRPEAQGNYPEVMTGQGSCWFTTRKWNDHIGLLDERVGSWGNVGIEISLRTWLCGGRQIVNKKAWQAHWFRKDEGGFTYPMDGRKVAKAHNFTRTHYYFNDHAFKNQTRPFKWIIEKFWPVPGWEAYMVDEFKTPRTIIYYTDHHIEESLAAAVRKNLTNVAPFIPIISVTQKPLNFGKNICVGEKPRANRSIYEQILAGLEAAEPGSVVYLCEHDVVYCPAHFAHIPEVKDRIDYNQNRFYWAPGQTEYLNNRGKWPLSQLVAYREYLMEQAKKALNESDQPSTELYKGIQTHRFKSERPNVDIRHGLNFSQDGRWKKEYYAGKSDNTTRNIGHWGSPAHMLSKLGWTPNGNGKDMTPIICRLLREHYGLKKFLPAPIRVPGFKRVDVGKIINMLGLKKGVEVGVRGGHHSEMLCQNIENIDLACVDIWEGAAEKWLPVAKEKLYPYGARFYIKPSMDAVREFEDNSLDWVYIDANHEFDFVMQDLIEWSKKVKPGGIVAGHDYDKAHMKGVVPAVDLYSKMHHIEYWFITDEQKETSFFWVKP